MEILCTQRCCQLPSQVATSAPPTPRPTDSDPHGLQVGHDTRCCHFSQPRACLALPCPCLACLVATVSHTQKKNCPVLNCGAVEKSAKISQPIWAPSDHYLTPHKSPGPVRRGSSLLSSVGRKAHRQLEEQGKRQRQRPTDHGSF
jgi:hypothetical protein